MSVSVFQRMVRWLVVASFLGAGFAMAQSEPTLDQIYTTAQAGKLDQAQVMVQQVLIAHPNSGKAHYVQSELFARQGKMALARESLATAERLSPGLPFAKPASVQELRAQLASNGVPARVPGAAPKSGSNSNSMGWLLPVLLAGGVIVLVVLVLRRKSQAQTYEQRAYNNGLNGPQTFGNGPNGMAPAPAGYGSAQPMYGQPQGPGLGSRIAGGVATGLAVGAGFMAAEAIGRNLMGNHDGSPHPADTASNDFQGNPANADMGGNDFGVNNAGGWDDSGSGDSGGGSDWDS